MLSSKSASGQKIIKFLQKNAREKYAANFKHMFI